MHSHTTKQQRQRQLLALLTREHVGSQEELRRRLAARGIRVTQATLSRDIRDLGLARTRHGYKPVGGIAHPAVPALARLLRDFVSEIVPAGQLILLKTNPGSAQPVALSLDSEQWKEVAGTIAGDDTVLVVTPSLRAGQQVLRRLEHLIRG